MLLILRIYHGVTWAGFRAHIKLVELLSLNLVVTEILLSVLCAFLKISSFPNIPMLKWIATEFCSWHFLTFLYFSNCFFFYSYSESDGHFVYLQELKRTVVLFFLRITVWVTHSALAASPCLTQDSAQACCVWLLQHTQLVTSPAVVRPLVGDHMCYSGSALQFLHRLSCCLL